MIRLVYVYQDKKDESQSKIVKIIGLATLIGIALVAALHTLLLLVAKPKEKDQPTATEITMAKVGLPIAEEFASTMKGIAENITQVAGVASLAPLTHQRDSEEQTKKALGEVLALFDDAEAKRRLAEAVGTPLPSSSLGSLQSLSSSNTSLAGMRTASIDQFSRFRR